MGEADGPSIAAMLAASGHIGSEGSGGRQVSVLQIRATWY